MPLFQNFLFERNLTETQYLDNIFAKMNWECTFLKVVPQELRDCTCCERHRKNFPKDNVKWVDIEQSERSKFSTIPPECDCPCRFISRMICRRIPDDLSESSSEYSYENLNSDSDGETLGSEDSESDLGSDYETDSDDSFIVKDSGMSRNVRMKLDKIKNRLSHGKL